MRWAKIKSIMVYFLLAMNIFMLVFIAVDSYKKTVIPTEVTQASMDILKKSGFECDEELFPDSYHYIAPLDATFYSASDLSDLFFGKQVAFRTRDNSLVATYEGATLTVYSNYFTYTTESIPEKVSSEKLEDSLEHIGIDTEDIVYDEKADCFYKMHNNTNLFNMYIEVKLDKNGEICNLSAQWPKEIKEKEKQKISFTGSVIKLKEEFPKGGKITKIELGYSLKSFGGGKYTFNPAWRVMVNGKLKILE